VAESGPYFHDGSGKTLEAAVDVLLKGGIDNPHKDAKLKAREISGPERKALILWLRSLSPEPVKFERPKMP
jgi:cytochrome c peroxidase